LIDNSGSKVRRGKRECRWAQRIIDRWARDMLIPDHPIVTLFNDEDESKDESVAGYGKGYIFLNPDKWRGKDNFWKLFILGHEFIHWLQDIRDIKLPSYEQEAYKLGLGLARKEIKRWGRKLRLPIQLELPLE